LSKEINFFIIEGDQQTTLDAERIQNAGSPVVQINTGNGCHLDAEMINKAITKLEIVDRSVLIIENVGNLVCPSSFDLGNHSGCNYQCYRGRRQTIKISNDILYFKYMYNYKTDLLPYVDFNVNKCKEFALRINHHLQFFDMSVKSGEGLENWYYWLRERYKKSVNIRNISSGISKCKYNNIDYANNQTLNSPSTCAINCWSVKCRPLIADDGQAATQTPQLLHKRLLYDYAFLLH